jgi:CRP-like cAMP-binding protein
LGGETMPIRAVVQSPGIGYRIGRKLLLQEAQRTGGLRQLVLRYTQALIAQIMQTVACTRHHTVDQRLCCWLLLIHDRVRSPELRMTQEMIASMLGVRREGINEAASKMQAAGLIRYGRGVIHVIDRPGLEARACECYDAVKQEYARVLPSMHVQD